MKKLLLTLLMIVIVAVGPTVGLKALAQAHDGNDGAHGGDAVVCRQSGTIEILDYVEGADTIRAKLDLDPDTTSYQTIIADVLKRLARLDPASAKRYAERAVKFEAESNFLPAEELRKITDYNPRVNPKLGCVEEQFANQIHHPRPLEYRYLVNNDLWSVAPNHTKAGLVLHEVIYTDAMDLGQDTSDNARYFNYIISSNKMNTFTEFEFGQILFAEKFYDQCIFTVATPALGGINLCAAENGWTAFTKLDDFFNRNERPQLKVGPSGTFTDVNGNIVKVGYGTVEYDEVNNKTRWSYYPEDREDVRGRMSLVDGKSAAFASYSVNKGKIEAFSVLNPLICSDNVCKRSEPTRITLNGTEFVLPNELPLSVYPNGVPQTASAVGDNNGVKVVMIADGTRAQVQVLAQPDLDDNEKVFKYQDGTWHGRQGSGWYQRSKATLGLTPTGKVRAGVFAGWQTVKTGSGVVLTVKSEFILFDSGAAKQVDLAQQAPMNLQNTLAVTLHENTTVTFNEKGILTAGVFKAMSNGTLRGTDQSWDIQSGKKYYAEFNGDGFVTKIVRQ